MVSFVLFSGFRALPGNEIIPTLHAPRIDARITAIQRPRAQRGTQIGDVSMYVLSCLAVNQPEEKKREVLPL